MSFLAKLYPYQPIIDPSGNIDSSSIHTPSSEIAFTMLATSLPVALSQKPSVWTLAGSAVVGALSYLFWTKLGQSIPQEAADQICIKKFLSLETIPDGIAKRVLANNSLHESIYAQITSIQDLNKKNLCLEFYFFGLWEHASDDSQKKLFVKAVDSSCASFLNTINKNSKFLDLITDEERVAIWQCAQTGPVVKSLMNAFDVEKEYNGKTILEIYAAQAIEKQDDQAKCNSIITSMNILLKNKAIPSLHLKAEYYSIKRDSTLGRLILNNHSTNNAESLFKKLLD